MARSKKEREGETGQRRPAPRRPAQGAMGNKPGMSGTPTDNEGLVMDSDTLTTHHQQRPKPGRG